MDPGSTLPQVPSLAPCLSAPGDPSTACTAAAAAAAVSPLSRSLSRQGFGSSGLPAWLLREEQQPQQQQQHATTVLEQQGSDSSSIVRHQQSGHDPHPAPLLQATPSQSQQQSQPQPPPRAPPKPCTYPFAARHPHQLPPQSPSPCAQPPMHQATATHFMPAPQQRQQQQQGHQQQSSASNGAATPPPRPRPHGCSLASPTGQLPPLPSPWTPQGPRLRSSSAGGTAGEEASGGETPGKVSGTWGHAEDPQHAAYMAGGEAAAAAAATVSAAGAVGLPGVPGRSTPARSGWSGLPRVTSISEIEPVVEVDEPRSRPGSSLLTRAFLSSGAGLGSGGADRPRTYRVTSRSGSQGDVTVVLEGSEPHSDGAGGGGSLRGGRFFTPGKAAAGGGGGGGGGSSSGYHTGASCGGSSSLPSGGGAGGLLGASLLSPGSLFGGLFGAGSGGGGAGAGTGGGGGGSVRGATWFATPDNSVHGGDSLPLRYHNYSSGDTTPSHEHFDFLPASSSLPLSRAHNASAGSILNKATGVLHTPMRKATSFNQFGPTGQSMTPFDFRSSSSGAAAAAGGGSVMGCSNDSGEVGGASSSLGTWMRNALPRLIPRVSSDGARGGGGGGGGLGSGRPSEPDLADLAVLASSLPASLGTWSLPRSVALASSPHSANPSLSRCLSRANSTSSTILNGNSSAAAATATPTGASAATAGATAVNGGGGSTAATNGGPMGPPAYPICLICLDILSPEDFEAGDAMQLECACRGEVAMRHRKCAIEWSHHKGDIVCDICKQPIANLPPIPVEVLAAREAARRRRQPAFSTAAEPTLADYIFDCIRAIWVTMIVCVLFFDLSVEQSFAVGLLVGALFTVVSAAVAACARRARARAAARAVERAAEESRAQERRQQREREEEQERRRRQQQGRQEPESGASGLTQPLLDAADEV